MTSMAGWLALVPAVPFLLACMLAIPRARRLWRLTPLAVLPALVVAFAAPDGAHARYDWFLLGTELALDPIGRGFLVLSALLWGAAALYAQGYHRDDSKVVRFHVFFLLAMAGNLGLVLAYDVVSFFVYFALMSVASFGLVVHEGRPECWRAGWVYLALAVIGEVALFSALAWQVGAAAGRLALADLAVVPPSAAVLALLIVGFGIKAGLLPLHVWLPLAHPAAPTPASAVLSGAMIKAGLLGWLRLLPSGEPLVIVGDLLLVLGLLGAYFGVIVGVTQRRPKTVLAYSSISQMGLMTAGLGLALRWPELAPALIASLVFYALHHGLAKGALFLGVGIAERPPGRWSLLVTLWPALALAGLPLTSGAVAKLALKAPLEDPSRPDTALVLLLLTLAAAGTTLLMVRFFMVIGRSAGPRKLLSWWMVGPWLLLSLAAFALPWAWDPESARAPLALDKVWSLSWPIGLGLLVGFAAMLLARSPRVPRIPTIPEGDLLEPLERGSVKLVRVLHGWVPGWQGGFEPRSFVDRVLGLRAFGEGGERVEIGLRRWEVQGAVVLLVMLGLFGLLAGS